MLDAGPHCGGRAQRQIRFAQGGCVGPAYADGATGVPGQARPRLTLNQKRAPAPGALSTPADPCISSAMPRTMESPRPEPPNRRVMVLSTWVNGWKSRLR